MFVGRISSQVEEGLALAARCKTVSMPRQSSFS